MKVILLEDVKSLGKKGQVVEASDGYARKVLFSKKQGIEATNKNLNDLKLKNQHVEKVAQDNLKEAQALAAELAKKQVVIPVKTGEGGKIFGSVSTKEIAAAAKEQLDLEVDKKKMQLHEGIKTLGIHEVPLKLHAQVIAALNVKVIEE